MKQTKSKDLRALSAAEIAAKVQGSKDALFKLRIRKETRQLEDNSGLRVLRRDIARMYTIARQGSQAAVSAAVK